MTESATIDRFLEAMRSAGVQMNTGSAGGRHPIADGKIHRADSLDPRGKGKKHVWYVLHLDEPASGAFGDYKLGIQDTWTGGRDVKSLTPAERAAIKARMEDARRQREEAAAAMAAKAAEVAALIMTAENSAKADPEHPYLKRKGLPVFPGLRQLTRDVKYEIDPEDGSKVARKGALVVPMYHATADRPVLVGVQFIRTDGVKMFLKGTPKARAFHPIGKPPEEGADIFIAEGYATAARVHATVGTRTFAAFDTGNLKPVVQVLAKKYPRSRFVFMADNDRFTTKPVDNPGVHFAREAAVLVGGAVVVPHFLDGEEDKSDFDDLAQLRGLEAVRAAIDAVLNPQPEPPAFDEPPPHDSVPDHGESLPPLDDPNGPVDFSGANFHLETFGHPHFRCLGVDGLTCFYQPLDVAQVVSLTASAHKLENLQMLAPLQWWEAEFPAKKEGVDMKMAVNTLIRACKHKRKFVAHNAMRGRGAWFEGETPIFHAGDRLIVGGENKAIADHSSRFVYDEGVPVPVDLHNPMTTAESRRFLDLCKSLRWQSPLSAYMLAGWCAIAPVCGFLKWRPHMWINGEAGAGKSTVMDKIVKVCLSTTAHSVVGNTTEAGIRGALGMDALPIIFDEAEPRDMESKNRLKSIMDLARVAASESDGLILKGTANQGTKGYRARSMFVFASINMQIEGYADESRFTQLTLVRPEGDLKSAGNKAHYEKLVSDIVSLMTPDFAQRLLARTIQHLPTLRRYVAVFTEAATLHLGTQRLGDQVGPMLAGAYLLNTSSDITVAGALEWIRSNDWTGMSARDATKDNDRFLQHVTGYLVKHNTPEGGSWERTIGELIDLAANAPEFLGNDFYESEPNKQKRAAIAALARLGIRVADDEAAGRVAEFTTSYEGFRKSVLRNTEWSGTKYRDILKAIPGAVSGRANRYFSSGVNTPYVAVPLGAILQEQELKNL